jgi:hypothetical protein
MADPDLYQPREQFVYRVTYGWAGMPSRTELVDLRRPVELGMQIKIGEEWWRVDRARRPGLGDKHRGYVEASPAP